MDPRHQERVNIIENLFATSFSAPDQRHKLPHPKEPVTPEIQKYVTAIDETITRHAPKYPLDNVARIDVSILRLAVYELMYDKKEPPKVIINEAVELAKEMGNERSFAFVNAVLGSILEEFNSETKNEPSTT
ncbi:MAG: transcription antitermination factor NusB [Weeksellaceae bacterium]